MKISCHLFSLIIKNKTTCIGHSKPVSFNTSKASRLVYKLWLMWLMWWLIYHKCEHGDQKAWKAFKSCQPSLQKMIFKNKFTNLFHYFKFGLFEVKSFKKLVSIEKPYLGFFLSVYQAEEKAAVVHFDSFLLWTPFVSDPGLYSFVEHFDGGLFSLWSGLSLVSRFSLIRI